MKQIDSILLCNCSEVDDRWCQILEINPLTGRISPYNINTISSRRVIKQTSDENNEKYYIIKLIQSQILQTNIARTVWQTVRRITNEILWVKGLMVISSMHLSSNRSYVRTNKNSASHNTGSPSSGCEMIIKCVIGVMVKI